MEAIHNIGRLKTILINGYVDGFERITDYIDLGETGKSHSAHIRNMVERLQADGYGRNVSEHSLTIVNHY